MNWSEEYKPNEEVRYNHIKLSTPIGEVLIDWKGWKEYPCYDVCCDDKYIGTTYDLEEAKQIAETYIKNITNELVKFIQ